MRKGRLGLVAMAVTMMLLATACGNETTKDTSEQTTTQTVTEASKEDKVASKEEMASVEDVVEDGMEPVTGDQIQDGDYDVTVDSSSSMFHVTACKLTVKDGKMTAVMTMGGTGYLYVFMGTGEEAVSADEKEYIPFVETDSGEHTFEVPVEALDKGIACTAFSRKKEKWYDRTLVFRADSLPQDAFVDGVAGKDLSALSLADGVYTVEASLEGGSGRASIESPAKLRVEDGKAYVTIVWSSANYDYMIVDDVKYEWDGQDEFSTFEIPMNTFDWKYPVTADTTAMSEPHEIEYTIYLDSATIQEAE